MGNPENGGGGAKGQGLRTTSFFKELPLPDFKRMYKNYEKTVKKGEKSKDQAGNERINQTKWVWFPKETLDRVFEVMNGTTDPRYVKGVKIYLTVYDQTDRPGEGFDYTGLMTNVLVASLLDTQDGTINDVEPTAFAPVAFAPVENAGTMSPPNRTTGDMVK